MQRRYRRSGSNGLWVWAGRLLLKDQLCGRGTLVHHASNVRSCLSSCVVLLPLSIAKYYTKRNSERKRHIGIERKRPGLSALVIHERTE